MTKKDLDMEKENRRRDNLYCLQISLVTLCLVTTICILIIVIILIATLVT